MSVTRMALIALVTLSAACNQAPTRPTVTEQPPIVTAPPNPPKPASMSGDWVGTFNASDHDSDCSFFANASASASFSQEDDRVHGTLSVVYACWPTYGGVAFDGMNDAGIYAALLAARNSPAKPPERSREMCSNCKSRTCGIRREPPQSSQQA